MDEWIIIGILFLCCCCCCAGCALATRRTLRRRVQARARKLVASASSAFMHGSGKRLSVGSGKRLSVGAVKVSIGEMSSKRRSYVSIGETPSKRRSYVTVPTDYEPKPVVTWIEFYDEAVGASYYASNTGETTWDRPTTGVIGADSNAQRADQADAASRYSCTLAV